MLIKTYFSQKSTSCRGGSLAQPDKLDPLLRVGNQEIHRPVKISSSILAKSRNYLCICVTTFILTLKRASREETIPIQKVSSDNFSSSV